MLAPIHSRKEIAHQQGDEFAKETTFSSLEDLAQHVLAPHWCTRNRPGPDEPSVAQSILAAAKTLAEALVESVPEQFVRLVMQQSGTCLAVSRQFHDTSCILQLTRCPMPARH